jgi:FkbM family methyltransferase
MFLDFLDPIDREIILYQKFENEEVTEALILMQKYSIKTFLDIGANCGYYSIKVLNEISEAKIIAFEPNKDAFSKFEKTISANQKFIKNIEIKDFGLSNQNASLKMKFLTKHNYNQTGGSSVINDPEFKEKNFFYAKFKIGDEILDIKNQKYVLKLM